MFIVILVEVMLVFLAESCQVDQMMQSA